MVGRLRAYDDEAALAVLAQKKEAPDSGSRQGQQRGTMGSAAALS